MKFSLDLATNRVAAGAEFASFEGISEIARAAENAGYGAAFVTDHPFPVQRWLEGGGHHALDPFVALSFAAAATSRLRVQTNILVLPYRNPFLVAKAALTLDLLSQGRLTLGVAVGYLRGEFHALGADFEARNETADEVLLAMKRAWTEDDVHFKGRTFEARGNTMRPRPVQQPHPPLWVGGNSRRAIRRAIEHGDGWIPFPNTPAMAPHTRTAVLESLDDLARRIALAREDAAAAGRTRPLEIAFSLDAHTGDGLAAQAACDRVHRLADLGVTWLTVGFPAATRAEYLVKLERFARDVIEPCRSALPAA